MVRIGSFLALAAAIVFSFSSCTKDKNEDCPFLAPHVIYVGFSENESDTLVFHRYEKNSNFSKLIDTMRITRAHIQRIAVGEDSFRLEPDNYPEFNAKFYLHDWIITVPAVRRSIRITDATPRFTQEKQPSAQCQSYVSSVMFDDKLYSFTSWFDIPYRVYAVK